MTLEQYLRQRRAAGDDLTDTAVVARTALFHAGWRSVTTTLAGLNDTISEAVGNVAQAEQVVNRLLVTITNRANNSPAVDAVLTALKNGVEASVTGPSTRGVLLDEIANGNVTEADQAVLMSVLRFEPVYTAQDITDTLAKLDRQDAADAADDANSEAFSKLRQINAASVEDADVTPVTLTVPATPNGYVWDGSTLVKES